jgi:hypothetical protein
MNRLFTLVMVALVTLLIVAGFTPKREKPVREDALSGSAGTYRTQPAHEFNRLPSIKVKQTQTNLGQHTGTGSRTSTASDWSAPSF